MPKLSQELFTLVNRYHKLRFDHWDKADRNRRKSQVIRKLKSSDEAEREAYAERVREFLRTNGHNDQQHQS